MAVAESMIEVYSPTPTMAKAMKNSTSEIVTKRKVMNRAMKAPRRVGLLASTSCMPRVTTAPVTTASPRLSEVATLATAQTR